MFSVSHLRLFGGVSLAVCVVQRTSVRSPTLHHIQEARFLLSRFDPIQMHYDKSKCLLNYSKRFDWTLCTKVTGQESSVPGNHQSTIVTILPVSCVPLVVLGASRCGPCRMVGPIVDEVIDEHGAKLAVLEICTDENPETVAKFKIRNIPTLMLFNQGKSVMTVVGAVPKSALVSSIKKHMDL